MTHAPVPSLEQLLTWSSKPGLLPRVPAGPDRGKTRDRISVDSLREFARDRDADLRLTAATKLSRRGDEQMAFRAQPAQKSLF